MSAIDVVKSILKYFVISSPFIALIIWFIRYAVEKWLDSKFNTRLEKEKHQYDIELHELRKKLDSELNRTIKLQDREFLILPEMWALLQDAVISLNQVVSLLRVEPDLNRMGSEQVEVVINEMRFSDYHKNQIRKAQNKNETFKNINFWHEIDAAESSYWKYRIYKMKNIIFLRKSLKEQFEKLDKSMISVMTTRKWGKEDGDLKSGVVAYEKLEKELNPLIKSLEDQIQEILQK